MQLCFSRHFHRAWTLFSNSQKLSRKYSTVKMGDKAAAVTLPNSEQFYLDNEKGETYLIQISWPLHWQDRTTDRGQIPIM
jgi:hypothetical protein